MGKDEKSGWISVKDKMPDMEGAYLAAWKPDNEGYKEISYKISEVYYGKFYGQKLFVELDKRCFCDWCELTHWQPMPEPPEEA